MAYVTTAFVVVAFVAASLAVFDVANAGGLRMLKNNNPVARKILKRELKGAHETVYVVGGNPAAGAYEGVADTIRDLKKSNPKLNIEFAFFGSSLGPKLEQWDIAALAREHQVRLYELSQEPRLHFRIIDPEGARPTVYIEETHEDDAESRNVREMPNARLTAHTLEKYYFDLKNSARELTLA